MSKEEVNEHLSVMEGIEKKIADRLSNMQSTEGVDKEAIWAGVDQGLSTGSGSGWKYWIGAVAVLLFIAGGTYFMSGDSMGETESSDSKLPASRMIQGEEAQGALSTAEDNGSISQSASIDLDAVESRAIQPTSTMQDLEIVNPDGDVVSTPHEGQTTDHRTTNSQADDLAEQVQRPGMQQATPAEAFTAGASEVDIGSTGGGTVLLVAGASSDVSDESGMPSMASAKDEELWTDERIEEGRSIEAKVSLIETERERLETMPQLGWALDMEFIPTCQSVLRTVEPIQYVRTNSLLPDHVELSMGPAWMSQSFNNQVEEESVDPSTLLTSIPGARADVQLVWQLDKDFRLGTGFAYSRLRQRFDLFSIEQGSTTIEDHVLGITLDSLGTSTPVLGPHDQSAVITRTIKHFNKFELLEIPVFFGYRKSLDKFELGADFRLSYTMLRDQQGRMTNASGELIDISENNGPLPKSFITYGLRPYLNMDISERTSITLAPQFIYRPMEEGGLEGMNTNLIQTSVQVGIRYRLN